MTAHCPIPPAASESRSTALRVTCGWISLSSSSHFPLKLYSNWVNPVALRPGRARLSTMPAPTGSMAWAKTIGTVRLARCRAWYVAPTPAKTTSEPSATSSSAYGRSRARSPAAQRYSIRALRPTAQPASCSPCRNAARRICDSGSSALVPMSTPIRRMRSPCCACAASGNPTAAPAEQRDELAPSDHSITSSARASNEGGISRPRAFAVLRLMANSYLVGACTGRSAGFSPLRMRST